mgnify:CR=1 FL=1
MIVINDPFFCDPYEDLCLPVIDLNDTADRPLKLDRDHFYLIGDTLYKLVQHRSMSDVRPGTIIQIGDKYFVEPYVDEQEDLYNKRFIVSKAEYDKRIQMASIDDMMESYASNYGLNQNIIKSGNIKITPVGEVYMPELESTDDPLERIIKLTLRHMKPVLNEYRGSFDKKHGLDNIKSALNGATKNMSILKFLSWCESFNLDWEITIDNSSSGVPNPMQYMIVMNNHEEFPWEEIPEETKECFTVPLSVGEDPLKRGIKLALGQKLIDLKDYRKKSPTQHLINNMKSALKSKQKMTLPYFLNWCEIIDLKYSFKVLNTDDGVWYKISGFDVTTNDKEME